MEYKFVEFKVGNLISLIDKGSINLNPDYQRNYIWSPNDQKSLIDTLLLGYPLPSFFVYKNNEKRYEMVDGQQRSKTIYRFVKGKITSSKSTGAKHFADVNQDSILNYRLPVILIENLTSDDNLRNFYVLINKKGMHLNVPEVSKSEHFDKLFLKLADEVLDYQNLIDLNIFTEMSIKRMNDRAVVEELLGYLKLGIREKKKSVEIIYKEDINKEEYNILKTKFYRIIDHLAVLNGVYPIKKTRYKQKNDFYTLFSFVHQSSMSSQALLNHQYSILRVLDGTDKDGLQFIRPTNEDSFALKEYANNCVSQSNSIYARNKRLEFFNAVLKNKAIENNEILTDVLNYLAETFGEDRICLKGVEGYELLDTEQVN